MHLHANFGERLSCVNFLALLMRLLEIPKVWELLHCGKCAMERFFLKTLQIKWLLSYHGNGKGILGIK